MRIKRITVGELDTNCYIVLSDSGQAAVIDPGSDFERIDGELTGLNADVKMILLTHAHYDHTGAVNELKKKYCCLTAVHSADEELLSDDEKNAASYMHKTTEPITADRLLEDGDEVQVGELVFTVIATPGHTKGGVTYRIADKLFTGDTLFKGTVGRSDLYGGNPLRLMRSIAKLMRLEGDFEVLPGHGEATTLRQEEATNPYIRKIK